MKVCRIASILAAAWLCACAAAPSARLTATPPARTAQPATLTPAPMLTIGSISPVIRLTPLQIEDLTTAECGELQGVLVIKEIYPQPNLYFYDLTEKKSRKITLSGNPALPSVKISPDFQKVAYYYGGNLIIVDVEGNIQKKAHLDPDKYPAILQWVDHSNLLLGTKQLTFPYQLPILNPFTGETRPLRVDYDPIPEYADLGDQWWWDFEFDPLLSRVIYPTQKFAGDHILEITL